MPVIPIPTIHLFPELEKRLIELLHSLTPGEWNKPTIARLWTVKDIAAHLLDGNLRAISMLRDNYFGDTPPVINTHDELVAWLNRLNADFVIAMKRVSPSLLVQWLESSSRQYYELLARLDPFAEALFAVSWAGDTVSPNWFHIAREYTERWHHQQQLRDAVAKPGIMTKELYYPVLDTFMMALPHTYRNVAAPENTIVKISISGAAGGHWWLVKKENWQLTREDQSTFAAHTAVNGDIAWKLFTKSWRKQDVMPYVSMEGDHRLATPVLDMISVMA